MCSVLGNKLPFAGSQNKPKCKQYSDRYEIMAHLFIDNSCSDRRTPRNDKGNLNNASDHNQKHFKNWVINFSMKRTGIICDYKQNSDTNCVQYCLFAYFFPLRSPRFFLKNALYFRTNSVRIQKLILYYIIKARRSLVRCDSTD